MKSRRGEFFGGVIKYPYLSHRVKRRIGRAIRRGRLTKQALRQQLSEVISSRWIVDTHKIVPVIEDNK